MELFPLFKLPYLAFKHVIVRLDFIKFAMCSSKCYQIVKIMRLKVRELTVFHNLYKQGLQLEFKQYFEYHWRFKSLGLTDTEEFHDYARFNSNHFPKKLSFNPAVNYVCAVECLVDFVRDLFKIDHITYELNSNGFTNFREYFLKQIVNRKNVCDEVAYGGYADEGNRSLPMENSDVSFVLENTPADMELQLSGIKRRGFRYDKPLTQKSIMFPGGMWLTPSHLYNSSFQILYCCGGCQFTLEDYNLLVKKWLNYELQKNFESVYLSINYSIYGDNWLEDEKNLKVLFDGLELKEFDYSRNLRDYRRLPYCFFKPHKLNDIQRDDGMIASFSLSKDTFAFRVWIPGKDRFSDM